MQSGSGLVAPFWDKQATGPFTGPKPTAALRNPGIALKWGLEDLKRKQMQELLGLVLTSHCAKKSGRESAQKLEVCSQSCPWL